ncbi:MAG: efflux RND transporter periplasmic adaptor subunit, partial [Candidatus Azobacteroides sp.]|nr:efflux RND transporter periplasmic adaptor subunit [Candidatus Azobacteroides sp.]
MRNLKLLIGLLSGVMLSALLLESCRGGKDQKDQKSSARYKVEVVNRSDATVYTLFPAQIQSEDAIEIYPRATGYIQKIYVQEGDNVKKGSPILKINDADYLQAVNSTKAAYDNALLEVTKLQPLVEEGIISPFQLQTAQSNAQAAQAAYENAKIDLSYTLITSPVSGVIGGISLREGSLLTGGIATPITTVASNGDVFAYFSFDEKLLLQFVGDSSHISLKERVRKLPPAELTLANGEIYEHKGIIELGSSLVDPTTGSLQMKGVFPNPDALLRSGSTGTIRIPNFYKNVIIVPQKATFDIQDKKMIFTVDSANIVHATNI